MLRFFSHEISRIDEAKKKKAGKRGSQITNNKMMLEKQRGKQNKKITSLEKLPNQQRTLIKLQTELGFGQQVPIEHTNWRQTC